MSDVVVTVPKSFGLERWAGEGDLPGEPWSGRYYGYTVSACPDIFEGERVYCVYNGRLIGYAPLVDIETDGDRFALIRRGSAVAVTIPEHIPGFRGFRYRWWDREEEVPFPEWRTTPAIPRAAGRET